MGVGLEVDFLEIEFSLLAVVDVEGEEAEDGGEEGEDAGDTGDLDEERDVVRGAVGGG